MSIFLNGKFGLISILSWKLSEMVKVIDHGLEKCFLFSLRGS